MGDVSQVKIEEVIAAFGNRVRTVDGVPTSLQDLGYKHSQYCILSPHCTPATTATTSSPLSCQHTEAARPSRIQYYSFASNTTSNTTFMPFLYTVGVDDGWQQCGAGSELPSSFHDASGKPIVNTTKFPNLKQMSADAAEKGFLLGWYENNVCIVIACLPPL